VHFTDWMALFFERFQSASRDVRLTLPPAGNEEFWRRFVETARIKNSGLNITLLLDSNPKKINALKAAVSALPEIEKSGHEVSWAASYDLPFSFFVIDDLWSLVVLTDTEESSDISFVRLSESHEEAAALRSLFDRKAGSGLWEIDPESWLSWLEKAPHRKPTRQAFSAINRGEKRFRKAVNHAIKAMPKRRCWLIKTRDSAYGIPEPPGMNHWMEWIKQDFAALGWPAIAGKIKPPGMPSRSVFEQHFKKAYPDQKNHARAYATSSQFIEGMIIGDRIAAVEGWLPNQNIPVRFHGWARIISEPVFDEFKTGWSIIRKAQWQRYDIDISVEAVREATGLKSATYPIHRMNTGAFRRLISVADEIRRNRGEAQLLLDLAMSNNTPTPHKD